MAKNSRNQIKNPESTWKVDLSQLQEHEIGRAVGLHLVKSRNDSLDHGNCLQSYTVFLHRQMKLLSSSADIVLACTTNSINSNTKEGLAYTQ